MQTFNGIVSRPHFFPTYKWELWGRGSQFYASLYHWPNLVKPSSFLLPSEQQSKKPNSESFDEKQTDYRSNFRLYHAIRTQFRYRPALVSSCTTAFSAQAGILVTQLCRVISSFADVQEWVCFNLIALPSLDARLSGSPYSVFAIHSQNRLDYFMLYSIQSLSRNLKTSESCCGTQRSCSLVAVAHFTFWALHYSRVLYDLISAGFHHPIVGKM